MVFINKKDQKIGWWWNKQIKIYRGIAQPGNNKRWATMNKRNDHDNRYRDLSTLTRIMHFNWISLSHSFIPRINPLSISSRVIDTCENAWQTIDNTKLRLASIFGYFLFEKSIERWLDRDAIRNPSTGCSSVCVVVCLFLVVYICPCPTVWKWRIQIVINAIYHWSSLFLVASLLLISVSSRFQRCERSR